MIQLEEQIGKKFMSEESLCEIWDAIRRNVYVIGIPKSKEGRKRQKASSRNNSSDLEAIKYCNDRWLVKKLEYKYIYTIYTHTYITKYYLTIVKGELLLCSMMWSELEGATLIEIKEKKDKCHCPSFLVH